MDRSMRRSDKLVTDVGWIEGVMKRGQVIHLALSTLDGTPYTVPLCYGYEDNCIYIHGANKGLKSDMLAVNSRVSFNVTNDAEVIRGERGSEFSMRYRSVSGWGSAVELTELADKNRALRVLMRQYDGPDDDLTEENAGSVWVVRIDITKMTGKSSGYPKPAECRG